MYQLFKNLIIIGLGGGIGSALRYLVQESLYKQFNHFEPYGTFVVNILGCLLLGILTACAEQGRLIHPNISLLLMPGFCGGFTTFSTFAYQGEGLLMGSKPVQGMLYVGLSVVIGLLAAGFGYRLVKV